MVSQKALEFVLIPSGTRPSQVPDSLDRFRCRRNLLSRAFFFIALLSFLFCFSTQQIEAADPQAIQASLESSTRFLRSHVGKLKGGHRSLLALALLSVKTPPDSPEIQGAVAEILEKFPDGNYRHLDNTMAVYSAAIDAMVLSDVDPEQYRPQLEILSKFLQERQLESGGWAYTDLGRLTMSGGNTNVTQFACLGLWAVSRAGIDVPQKVWVEVLNWHTQHQNDDGGFPIYTNVGMKQPSSLNMTINAVGSMHIAMLHLLPGFHPLTDELPKPESPKAGKKTAEQGGNEQAQPVAVQTVRIPGSSIPTVRKAFRYVADHYTPFNDEIREYKAFYLYSLEWMASLANANRLGERDWYQDSSDALLKVQKLDGSWLLSDDLSGRDTALCVLFLSKATAQTLEKPPVITAFGAGLLAGGRGLPDDLAAGKFDGRTFQGMNQPAAPLDNLLASLQGTGEVKIKESDDPLVNQIDGVDRKTLIGQTELLKRLAVHPQAEMRKTAMWAIGRSERMELGAYLIRGLDDTELSVMLEARDALCWLARRPKGFGEANDPLAGLAAESTEQQKMEAITAWHRRAMMDWGNWYLQARPYADRGDAFEAALKRKLADLRIETLVPSKMP